MSIYLVRFTPLEPYFFGNEKTFGYGTVKNKTYYVESSELPSQSGLFGTLRYCCISRPGKNYKIDPGEIGSESFNIRSSCMQTFGKIHRMSPLFVGKGNDLYITVPADHKKGELYNPFSEYADSLTERGSQRLPLDYKCKDGIQSGFMQITGEDRGRVYLNSGKDSILYRVERTGINTLKKEQGLFRKICYMLKPGYSFAVLADIDKQVKGRIAYMGRDKSVFRVTFEPAENLFEIKSERYEDYFSALSEMIRQCLIKTDVPGKIQIALSDLYIPDRIGALYDNCSFACVRTGNFRSFTTNYSADRFENRFRRGARLQTMIRGGSAFILKDGTDSLLSQWEQSVTFRNARQIGYNIMISND